MLCGPTNPTTCNLCVSANQTLPPVFEKPKTRLAQIRGYQVRRGEKGTQVQYWRFDEERKIKDSNGRPIIDANGEPRTEKVRLEEEKTLAVKAVKHWLSSHQGWLLILDNVILDNADELRMVSAFLPSEKNGHVLLTIQAHAVGAIAPGVDIQEMEIDEAARFLLRRAGALDKATEADWATAREIGSE